MKGFFLHVLECVRERKGETKGVECPHLQTALLPLWKEKSNNLECQDVNYVSLFSSYPAVLWLPLLT
jgi:hypothetical protein